MTLFEELKQLGVDIDGGLKRRNHNRSVWPVMKSCISAFWVLS